MAEPHEYQQGSTDYGPLSVEQAENIADLAARRAEARLYTAIGRSVVKKALYLAGAAGAAFLTWWSGLIHFGPK
jgi:hypothetical protein